MLHPVGAHTVPDLDPPGLAKEEKSFFTFLLLHFGQVGFSLFEEKTKHTKVFPQLKHLYS